MRVCLVSTIGYPNRTKLGGVPTCTRNMALALAAQGAEVRVITKRVGDVSFEETDGPVTIYGLPLGNLHYYLGKVAPIGIWPRVVKALEWGRNISKFVTRLQQQGKLDVVLYSNVWVEGFSHPKNVPFAVRMDTPLFAARTVPGCGDKTGWSTYERMERRVVRKADAVVCLTASAAAQVQSEYGLASNKTVVIPNPVDTDCFQPNGSGKGNELRIFHPGPRLDDWQKGTGILLNAMENVVAKFPQVRLVFAGTGKPDLSRVSSRVKQSVRMLGWLNPKQLAHEYALADVTVVPSLNYDSFPSVCLESLAAGTPIIGTAVGGIPDIVSQSETGLLVPPGDVDALSDALVRILSDSPLLSKMRQRAREWAVEKYGFQLVGRQMLDLCQRIVNDRGNAAL
jgi:glycosyltransferase involved in cell wall biosynthesis